MAKTSGNGVRIGPISLLTLISVLLLSVLAVLCVTTTNAGEAMAQRQAESTAEAYALDSCAQEIVACIDEELQTQKGSSAAFAASAMMARWDSIQQKVVATGCADGLQLSASRDDSVILFNVSASSGKTLSASVRISDGATYSIDQWKITTTQQTPEETLWSGNAPATSATSGTSAASSTTTSTSNTSSSR